MSLRNRNVETRGWQNPLVWQTRQGYNLRVLLKICFKKGEVWRINKSFFKQNHCPACSLLRKFTIYCSVSTVILYRQKYKMQTMHRKSRIWEMKNDNYTKSFTQNQVCAMSYTRYSRKCFIQIYKPFYGDAMLVSLWGAQIWWPESNRNFCLWVFVQKREFIAWGTYND